MESGYCGIRWAQYPSDAVSFTISGKRVGNKIYQSDVPKNTNQNISYIALPFGVFMIIISTVRCEKDFQIFIFDTYV